MVVCMKTTVIISDPVMAELRKESARQNRPMSEIIETALRLLFQSRKRPTRTPKFPRFNSGGHLVDISDRDALYDAMEER